MSSVFAWLDSSERERRRALDVIDLFDQPETVDELGLGTVRDTIADILSPGTSTIQTRARYFFFIPWIYLLLERRGNRSNIAGTARGHEVKLIDALAAAGETTGVIGIQSRKSLRRLPSAVYWAGLGRLGFRLYPGARDQFHRTLERGPRELALDDEGDIAPDAPFRGHWHPHIPPAPTDFLTSVSFALTEAEAGFLQEQLRAHASSSLLAFLVEQCLPVGDAAFPWLHPSLSVMPIALRQWLIDGQHYSELMHGAQLLYNLLLAEAKRNEAWVEDYRTMLDDWAVAVDARRALHLAWDTDGFWRRLKMANPRLPLGVNMFSQRWISHVLRHADAKSIPSTALARELVTDREIQLKGPRARLRSQTHLDLWRGESSPEPLNYRWRVTQRLVDDIVAGLNGAQA